MKNLLRSQGYYLLTCALLSCLSLGAQTGAQHQDIPAPFDPAYYPGLQWRNVGPFRGGRSVTITGVANQPFVYYMGTTGGGVWKTTDGGIEWRNISDDFFKVGSIGAVAVAPSDPNVLYVGTGEHPVRGVKTSHGDGVYRSTDAGQTWQHVGLIRSRHIAAIRVHPHDPLTAWVAVQGAAFGPSVERGIYKTTDGGERWRKVLFINETTGGSDLSLDVANPRILYAGTWDHLRQPWQIRSGGPGSGLYKSTDGGETWIKLTEGLPAEMGKTAISVSPADPQRVYANIEAEAGGVFRSDDAGQTWQRTTDARVTIARAWYYIEIMADPQDAETVYVMNAPLLCSIDGGKSFRPVSNPHSDQHELWINPANPKNLALANDGGATISYNGGNSWSPQNNQPTGQFYRVFTDNRFPYYLYGGQQDNSSIAIASRTTGSSITEQDWYRVAGGESAFIALDPAAPERVYGGSYQGNLQVYDHRTGARTDIMAYPNVGLATRPSEMRYRFNWNAPLVIHPQQPAVMYHGANVVLRTTDGGQSWTPISPDLTRNDTTLQGPGGTPYTNEGAGGENYNTLSYLALSPHTTSVIWAGSDDGLVHLTRNGGATWQNVTPPALGEGQINSIEVSPHDAATAYLAVTRHKFNNFSPLVYRTRDYGTTWEKVTKGIRRSDYVRVVREDPVRPGLLYAGTVTGLYISQDQGDSWRRFQLNLPVTPINDLRIQDADLVAATSGRAFWILDDLSSIRQSAGRLLNGTVQLFAPRPTVRFYAGGGRPSLHVGQNPTPGVAIDYYLPAGADSTEVWLSILDSEAQEIRRYGTSASGSQSSPGGPPPEQLLPRENGVNRFYWDMRHAVLPHVPGLFTLGSYSGRLAAPGDYRVRLMTETDTLEQAFTLLPDPRLDATESAFVEHTAFLTEVETTLADLHTSVKQLQDVRTQLQGVASRLRVKADAHPDLVAEADSLVARITTWEENLVQPQQKTFQDVINFPNRLNAELMNLRSRVDGPVPVVTQGARVRLADLQAEWQQHRAVYTDIVARAIPAFNQRYRAAELGGVIVGEKE